MTDLSTSDTQKPEKPRLLGPWRTAFQWLATLAVLLIPFARIAGNSLLQLDFSTLTLHLGGTVFPIEALWLFLLLTLALVLLFLLVTMAFGRAWCGWACPQTTLVDLVEWCARGIGVRVTAGTLQAGPVQKVALQLLYAFLAMTVAVNLCWYFVPPYDFFPQLLAGTLHWAAWTLIGFTALTVYLDLALLRRLFCKEFCPYGRFQTVLVDPGTLVLRFHPDEAPRCIRCGACVRVCPTGIDIRAGEQIECINCGRCLDACRQVMARRAQAGIIRYTFGLQGQGAKALLNLRMALVAAAFLGISASLAVAAWQRAPLTLKVARNPVLLPRVIAEDRVINFFSAFLVNRSDRPHSVTLAVDDGGIHAQWRGPDRVLLLAAGEHRRIEFGLEVASRDLAMPYPVRLNLQGTDGTVVGSAELTLTAPPVMPAAKRLP